MFRFRALHRNPGCRYLTVWKEKVTKTGWEVNVQWLRLANMMRVEASFKLHLKTLSYLYTVHVHIS